MMPKGDERTDDLQHHLRQLWVALQHAETAEKLARDAVSHAEGRVLRARHGLRLFLEKMTQLMTEDTPLFTLAESQEEKHHAPERPAEVCQATGEQATPPGGGPGGQPTAAAAPQDDGRCDGGAAGRPAPAR